MKKITIFIFAFFILQGLSSQDNPWTLEACINYAITNNPRVKNQYSQNSIYHQDYLEAIGNLLPEISGNTSAGFNFGRGVDEETNSYINVNSFSNNYGLNASLTLFDGLANYAKLKRSRIHKSKGKMELQDVKDMLAIETMEAFYNVLYNQDLVKVATEKVEESTQSLAQLRQMEELGLKSMPDVIEAESRLAEDNYKLTKQGNLAIIAILQLKEKMNYPIEDDLRLNSIDEVEDLHSTMEKASNVYDQAITQNPKALLAEMSLKASEQDYKASKGNLMPRLSVGAGLSTNFFRNMDGSAYIPFNKQLDNKLGEYVSFNLSIPLFSGFSRSASVKRAKSRVYMAENNREDAYRKLYNDIQQTITDVNGQVAEYHQAVKQREASALAHKVNLRKYEEGLIDPILLNTSANRLYNAQVEEYRAKYLFYVKEKTMNYYKGESLY